ncbi:MAG TPA: L,D-transpeptidase family protein [Porticoccaceae bacterium]|nr:L,D-transpeptidase family protein [Porticoccaceae bacterium]
MPRPLLAAILVCCALLPGLADARTFILTPQSGDVIGELRYITARHEDTLVDLARVLDLGYNEIRGANPSVDAWLPGDGTKITIPSVYLLPQGPREGIIVNLAEMRLYYYPKPGLGIPPSVVTHPVGVGRDDWPSPTGPSRIIQKIAHPAWYPPESIRREHAANGDPLPKVVPAGPDNPLGEYALRLDFGDYLLHGTNKTYGVGMQVSHGCIRLYPAAIESLFSQVPNGTRVELINQPYKAGVHQGRLYVEVHPPLGENDTKSGDFLALLDVVQNALATQSHLLTEQPDLQLLPKIFAAASGVPTPLYPDSRLASN